MTSPMKQQKSRKPICIIYTSVWTTAACLAFGGRYAAGFCAGGLLGLAFAEVCEDFDLSPDNYPKFSGNEIHTVHVKSKSTINDVQKHHKRPTLRFGVINFYWFNGLDKFWNVTEPIRWLWFPISLKTTMVPKEEETNQVCIKQDSVIICLRRVTIKTDLVQLVKHLLEE